jgi:hypothetical protein
MIMGYDVATAKAVLSDIKVWSREPLSRYYQKRDDLRPGGDLCWCCGQPGAEMALGSCRFECDRHPEGWVRWYGGAAIINVAEWQGV